jgi:hypothetical protein
MRDLIIAFHVPPPVRLLLISAVAITVVAGVVAALYIAFSPPRK